MTPTTSVLREEKTTVSKGAERLVRDASWGATVHALAPFTFDGKNPDEKTAWVESRRMLREEKEAALLAYISGLESDRRRLDWLEANMNEIQQVESNWVFGKQGLRGAIDSAIQSTGGESNG